MLFNYLVLGLVCVFVTWLATYSCRWLAWKLDILDHPTDRKVHLHPIPYLGGLGMFAGILAATVAGPLLIPELVFYLPQLRAFMIGAAAIVLLGLLDDVHDVPSLVKLAVTIGVGAFMYLNGFEIVKVSSLGGRGPIALTNGHMWISATITVVWYVVIMNAINIIDGLDGLAAGVCAIAALTLFCITLGWTEPLASALAIVIVGACLGFLPHNFPPAHIFMGDAGSLLIGLSLASLTVFSGTKVPVLTALVIPVLALGIPIVDIGYAFLRRSLKGTNPFRADRLHLHHRMMTLGLPTAQVLYIFYFITAYLGLLAYMLQQASSFVILLNAVLLAAGFFLLLGTIGSIDRRVKSVERARQAPQPPRGE